MAYTINKTDGTVFATVADGTVNTSSSMTIIGKNYAGYGEFLGENFIKLLENHASNAQPGSPLRGQTWFDSSTGLLKVYNGTLWKTLGSATASGSTPSGAVSGDLWFDSTNSQLKVYNGSTWILVGPSYTAGTGKSGAIVETVSDGSTNHVVVKLFVENTLVGTISKDATFAPSTPITGFATIKPGIQLSTTVSNAVFSGQASDADTLDGVQATGFLSSIDDDVTEGILKVSNDSGLYVGDDDDFRVSVNVSGDVSLQNNTTDGDLLFKVNDGGTTKTVITIDGASGLAQVNSNPTTALGIATKGYVDSATSASGNSLFRDGTNTITGNIVPDGNNTRNFGASGTRFNTIYATTFSGHATEAQYADLAERFEADEVLEPGTVVELGGIAEVTTAIDELSNNVFGVVSSQAAYLMNASAGSNETHPPIAMNGRVPVKVIGFVNKGDRLVSAGNGYARAAQAGEVTAFNVIGRALNNKHNDGKGTVEAIVKINF